MKKRILSLLLVLTLLVAVSVFAVEANAYPNPTKNGVGDMNGFDAALAEAGSETETLNFYCEACGSVQTWTRADAATIADNSNYLPNLGAANGHTYIPSSGVAVSTYQRVGYGSTAAGGSKFCLYLNGDLYRDTEAGASYFYIFRLYNTATSEHPVTMNVMGNGTAKMYTKGEPGTKYNGTVINLYTNKSLANMTLNIYEGVTLGTSDTSCKSGVVSAEQAYHTINMYGGKIVGGTPTTNGGGAVYLASGATFNMHGGEIKGSNIGTSLSGGAVYLSGGAKFNMGTDAQKLNTQHLPQISDGIAKSGGSVYVTGSGSTFTMGAGEISDGSATTSGGAVYLAGSTTFNMHGGSISGSAAKKPGGAVYMASSAKFYMGTDAQKLNETNLPTITGGAASYGGAVFIASNSGSFTMGAGTITGGATTNTGGAVHTEGTFTMNGGTINGSTAANGGAVHVGGGNFTMNAGSIINGSTVTGMGGAVCLGKPMNSPALTTSTFTMNGGTINGGTAANGGAVALDSYHARHSSSGAYYHTESTFTMTGGKIDGGTATENGGCVWVGMAGDTDNEGAEKIYKGTFILNGANAEIDGSSASAEEGVAVAVVGGDFQIGANGGKIVGGTTTDGNGGAVMLDKGTSNGTKGGEYDYSEETYERRGTFTMAAGNIACGSAKNGGNVMIRSGGDFVMNGGTIAAGTASNYGGNICMFNTATFKMNGGLLTTTYNEETADSKYGDNIGVWGDATGTQIDLLGGEISGGTGGGRVVYIYSVENGVTVNVGAVIVNGNSGNSDIISARTGRPQKIVMKAGFTDNLLIYADGVGSASIIDNGEVDSAYVAADGYTTGGTVVVYGSADSGTRYPVIGSGEKMVLAPFAVTDGRNIISIPESVNGAVLEEMQYVKLFNEVDETLNIGKDTYLDINGFNVTLNIDEGVKLYGMDTATNKYGTDGATAGVVTLAQDSAQPQFNTVITLKISGETGTRKYLWLENGFHRYYLSIDKVGLRTADNADNKQNPGITYSGVFRGDAVVTAAITEHGVQFAQQDVEVNQFKYTTDLTAGERYEGKLMAVHGWLTDEYHDTELPAWAYIKVNGQTIYSTGDVAESLKGLTEGYVEQYNAGELADAFCGVLENMIEACKTIMEGFGWNVTLTKPEVA